MRVYRSEKLKALEIEFKAPRAGDAGYDLRAIAACRVAPMARALVKTGLHLEIPAGFVGLIKDRSSIAAAGLHTLAGVIDSSYRGELKILLVNLGAAEFVIEAGQKIAQLLIVPVNVDPITFVETLDELSATERGVGGFGSTDNLA